MPSLEPDIDLADFLVDDVGGLDLGTAFDVERMWLAEWDAKTELDRLQIGILPSVTPSSEPQERGGPREVWPMDFGFVRLLTEKTRAEIDALARVTGIVRERFAQAELVTGGGFHFATFGRWEYLARFDPTSLNRVKRPSGELVYTGKFLSVLRIEFVRMD